MLSKLNEVELSADICEELLRALCKHCPIVAEQRMTERAQAKRPNS